jgi:hypothetical protein
LTPAGICHRQEERFRNVLAEKARERAAHLYELEDQALKDAHEHVECFKSEDGKKHADKKTNDKAEEQLKRVASDLKWAKQQGAALDSIQRTAQAERDRRQTASKELIAVAGTALRPSDSLYNRNPEEDGTVELTYA